MRPPFLRHARSLPSLASLALFSVSLAACHFELGQDTEGELGKLQFSYTGSGCLFGCGLDRPALQGSRVTLSSEGGDPAVRLKARIADEAIAHVTSQRESCKCTTKSRNETKMRSVAPEETCAAPEQKECSLSFEIEAREAGDPELEIVDPSGVVIDRVSLHVRPAARIDTEVKQGAVKLGEVYEARQGFKVKLLSRVYDAAGSELVFAQHGVSFDYGNKDVIGPDRAVLIGTTDVEDMIATGLGEATVRVHAPGAERIVRFRVVP